MPEYADLNIPFAIGNTDFYALNIKYEQLSVPIPKHSHSSCSYEIHFVSSGFGTAVIEGKKYEIVPNTLYVTGPYVEHEQISRKDDPMMEYCIYLKTNGKGAAKPAGAEPCASVFLQKYFWFGKDRQDILPVIQSIFFEMGHQYTGYMIQIKALLQQIIVKLVRNYEAPQSLRNPFPPKNLDSSKYIILEECFLYNYKNITLKNLADRLGLGIRQTERLLQEHYGKNFLQKKVEAKMSAAAILLLERNKSITDIANELGYSSLGHFSSAFRQYYHETAGHYRKTHRLKPDKNR